MNTDLQPSLAHLLINTAEKFANKTIYQEKKEGVFQDFKAIEVKNEAFVIAKSFIQLELNITLK